MVKMEYCEHGINWSDFQLDWMLETIIGNIARNTDKKTNTSTYIAINAVLTAIATGKIDHTKIIFIYNGLEYPVNEYGVIPDFPPNDPGAILAEERLIAASKKRKDKKEALRNTSTA